MATLSFSNAMALLGKAVWLLHQQKLYIDTNSEKLTDHIADIVAAAEGERYLQQNTVVSDRFNALSASIYSETSVQAFLKPFLDEVSLAIGKPLSGFETQLEDLRDYMVANSKTVEERTMSIGSVTAGGGNVGNGSIVCLSKDKYDNQIQSSVAETATIEVIAAQGSGANRNAERLRYLGVNRPTGSGLNVEFVARYDGETNKLQNPRFNSFFGTTKPTAGVPVSPTAVGNFANWVMNDITKFQANLDYPYRYPAGGASTAYGLSFVGNGNVRQELTQAGRSFDKDKPYVPAIIAAKSGSCDGTFTMAWGSKSQAFTVSSTFGTNGTIYIVTPDIDKDLFYENWMSDSGSFTLTLASWTTGKLHIIEAGLYTMEEINGLYYCPIGKEIPWQVGDLFTQAISQSADGLIQRWLTRQTRVKSGLVLPYSGTPTEADPS